MTFKLKTFTWRQMSWVDAKHLGRTWGRTALESKFQVFVFAVDVKHIAILISARND